MQYKKVLNILRFLLSASAILFGSVIIYSINQNKIIVDIKIIFALIISIFGGIIVGFTSIEDMLNINKKNYTGLAGIKQIIFELLWIYGLLMGVLFLVILIYSILISQFK